MRCLREVQTISQSPHILPMPSLTRLTTGGVLNPTKNTTNTSHNELLHQEPLQPPLEPRRLRKAFVADEMHISVEVTYHCAQQVREVFHQDTPTQSQHLAAHLIERLPTCPIPEIARLGQTLRKWKDALDAYIDTSGASNTSHRSHQRTLSN